MTCLDAKTCWDTLWQDNDSFKRTVLQLLAGLATDSTSPLAAGTHHIGTVGIDAGTNLIGTVDTVVDGTISTARVLVATAGTRVQLTATPTPCKRVDIQALHSNTGTIVVGGSDVVAVLGTRQGIAIDAKQVYSIDIDDLSKLYIDSTVNGEGVSIVYTR